MVYGIIVFTFQHFQLYKKNGCELCVVVSNVNQMDCQYCHVKTTPDMQIREAVRMSISLPGPFYSLVLHLLVLHLLKNMSYA